MMCERYSTYISLVSMRHLKGQICKSFGPNNFTQGAWSDSTQKVLPTKICQTFRVPHFLVGCTLSRPPSVSHSPPVARLLLMHIYTVDRPTQCFAFRLNSASTGNDITFFSIALKLPCCALSHHHELVFFILSSPARHPLNFYETQIYLNWRSFRKILLLPTD